MYGTIDESHAHDVVGHQQSAESEVKATLNASTRAAPATTGGGGRAGDSRAGGRAGGRAGRHLRRLLVVISTSSVALAVALVGLSFKRPTSPTSTLNDVVAAGEGLEQLQVRTRKYAHHAYRHTCTLAHGQTGTCTHAFARKTAPTRTDPHRATTPPVRSGTTPSPHRPIAPPPHRPTAPPLHHPRHPTT